ncbi:hypothetical protein OQA88_2054 [Cercophora sp. LCS_1]
MTTQHPDSVLLQEKHIASAPVIEKEIRNGTLTVNGRSSPEEETQVEFDDKSAPGNKDAKLDRNEEAFSANQTLVSGQNGVQEEDAVEENVEEEIASSEPKDSAPADSEMTDAPAKSPTPTVPDESTISPADAQVDASETKSATSPISEAISSGTKEDVVMDDAQTQPEASLVFEQAESTQETAASDALPATPAADASNIAAASAPTQESPSAPITADTSLSEVSQPTAKVSRERELDSEDEPAAKRPKVGTAAEQVDVKTEASPDRMDVDQPNSGAKPLYLENGEPKNLNDPSIDANPLTDYMARQLRNILAGVKKTKAGLGFRASVKDLWPMLWDDYSAKIEKPVDISYMERRLRGETSRYATISEFKKDVELLIANSIAFNGEIHDVTKWARQTRDAIYTRMAASGAAEPAKPEKKEPKQHPTRHAEPRVTAQPTPAAPPSPRRPSKSAAADPPAKSVESPAFAIPANNNGVPLIRRDSSKLDGRAKRPVKPAHSKDLVYETKRKKKLPPELRFCEDVLNELKKSKHFDINGPFLVPVDPVALNIPSYHKVVKKPMDLSTMGNKLSAGEYASAKEFEKDFDLIVKNCRLFNGEQHVVYAQALKLQSLFKKEFGRKDDWMAKHAPPPSTATFPNLQSPAPRDDSEDEERESDGEPEVDEEQKASQQRLATIQKRLEEEQKKVNDMINTGTAEITDVEIAQSVVAMLQRQLMGERAKLASFQSKKPAKPKSSKPKKSGALGSASKKASVATVNSGSSKKSGGAKKPVKRKMGALEKEVIAAGIAELDGAQLERAIDIIKKDTGQGENDSGELELDIEQLSDEALVRLYDLAVKAFPNLRADKEKSFAAPPAPEPPAPKPKGATTKNKKNKPMSRVEQERRLQQLTELRAQAGRQGSGSQEPMESIEGNGNGAAAADPTPNPPVDSDDEESSEEE